MCNKKHSANKLKTELMCPDSFKGFSIFIALGSHLNADSLKKAILSVISSTIIVLCLTFTVVIKSGINENLENVRTFNVIYLILLSLVEHPGIKENGSSKNALS